MAVFPGKAFHHEDHRLKGAFMVYHWRAVESSGKRELSFAYLGILLIPQLELPQRRRLG